MVKSFFVFLATLALVSAFAPAPFVLKTRMTASRLSMFNAGDDNANAKPLESTNIDDTTTTVLVTTTDAPRTMLVKNLGFGKGGEVKEVNFIDPAMAANTNPFQMNWWA